MQFILHQGKDCKNTISLWLEDLDFRLYQATLGRPHWQLPEWVLLQCLLWDSSTEIEDIWVRARWRASGRFRDRSPRRTIEFYMDGFESSQHPQAQWIYLHLLTIRYGELAIEPILRRMAQIDERLLIWQGRNQGYAWALGQLGRGVVLAIENRFQRAPPLLKEYYCQALWFLAERARGSARFLKSWDSPWSRAVLHNLPQEGWSVLFTWRSPFVYLCDQSLEAIARLVFSGVSEDQLYALTVLDSSWGPCRDSRERLALILLDDPHSAVRLGAFDCCCRWQVVLPEDKIPGWLWGHDIQLACSMANHLGLALNSARLKYFHQTPLGDHAGHLRRLLEEAPFSGSAEESLLPLIEDVNYPYRRLALRLYHRLKGPLKAVLGMLEDAHVRSLIVERLRAEGKVSCLLDFVDNLEVMSELLQPPGLAGFYCETNRLSFLRLLNQLELRRQEAGGERRSFWDRVLHCVSLEGYDWERWLVFQSSLGDLIIERNGRFPESLSLDLAEGRPVMLKTWIKWIRTLPADQAERKLAQQTLFSATEVERELGRNPS